MLRWAAWLIAGCVAVIVVYPALLFTSMDQLGGEATLRIIMGLGVWTVLAVAWAVFDVRRHPREVWWAIGRDRNAWTLGLLLLLLTVGPGALVGVGLYTAKIRPALSLQRSQVGSLQ